MTSPWSEVDLRERALHCSLPRPEEDASHRCRQGNDPARDGLQLLWRAGDPRPRSGGHGHRQAAHFGAELIKAAVTDVKKTEDGFRLMTEHGDFSARYVILATGATADLAAKIGLESRPATEPRIKTVLVVDPAGRTNIPGIWAAGTVAGRERSCRRDRRRRRPGGHQCDQPDQRRPLGGHDV